MNKGIAFLSVLFFLSASYVVVQPVRASADLWVSRTPVPISTTYLGAVTVNGAIYALTNLYNNTYNYVYNPSTDTWVSKTPMPTAGGDFAIANYQNKIYVIGGYNITLEYNKPVFTATLTNANQVYEPTTDTWQTKAPMPTVRANLQANVVKDKIYLIGGFQNDVVSDANEAYDSLTDSWTTMAPIPIPVYDYASAVVDNKIYVMGGMLDGSGGGSDLTQIYDPGTNSWTYGSPLPFPVWGAAAGAISVLALTRIYVVGSPSSFGVDSTDATLYYDVQTNSWTTGASIPVPGYIRFSIAVVNDTLYAMGGRPITAVIGYYPAANEQYFPLGSEEYSPSTSSSPTPQPSTGFLGTGVPMEYGYAIVAALVIITLVGSSLLFYLRKRPQLKQKC